jgi:3-phosphoshikimate 1-carboxyvinyltransferase
MWSVPMFDAHPRRAGLTRDSRARHLGFFCRCWRSAVGVPWSTETPSTAQTVAAVAVFAGTPTRVRGIGFIRAKECDRIGAMVTELRCAGIAADEHEDGFTIHPGVPNPTRVQTYDDHRMAMSMALLGLRAPGIQIENPECVAKTYPGYFADLARLG